MQNIQEILRAKVDQMRQAGYADSHSRSEVIHELSSAGQGAVAPDADDKALHMCPWHTCANTRHG